MKLMEGNYGVCKCFVERVNLSAESSQTQLHEFWKLPNVIATPHNIASTDAGMDAELRLAAENIRRVPEGKPAINQVNEELQY